MATRRERGRPPYGDVLTPAEWRVADKVRHGMTNRMIAERLGVSGDAIKFHVANILQKLGLSDRAELRRWDGVRLDSPLAHGRPGMEADGGLGAIGQIARSVHDIGAASAFYGEVLGLPHLYTYGTLAFFDCDGVRCSCRRAMERQRTRSSISASATSTSCSSVLRRAASLSPTRRT